MSRSKITLATLTSQIIACRKCPRLVSWREQVAREKRAAYAEQEYWGRQPHRARLHRRPLRRLAARRPASRRLCQSAHLDSSRRWPVPDRLLHRRLCPLRAAGEQAHAAGTRQLPALPGGGGASATARAGASLPGRLRLGWGLARPGDARPATGQQAAVRPRRRGKRGTVRLAGLLPPQPAEHLHGPADRSHARRGAGPCWGAGRHTGGCRCAVGRLD
jgi:hypothetical protein